MRHNNQRSLQSTSTATLQGWQQKKNSTTRIVVMKRPASNLRDSWNIPCCSWQFVWKGDRVDTEVAHQTLQDKGKRLHVKGGYRKNGAALSFMLKKASTKYALNQWCRAQGRFKRGEYELVPNDDWTTGAHLTGDASRSPLVSLLWNCRRGASSVSVYRRLDEYATVSWSRDVVLSEGTYGDGDRLFFLALSIE